MAATGTPARTRASSPEAMDARRASILAATARVIVACGVDNTRLADVSDEAGVSVGLIQHYFRNRDRLIVETFRSAVQMSRAEWRDSVEKVEDPLVRLRRLVRFTVSGETPFNQAWGLWLEFYASSVRHAKLREHVEEIMNIWRGLFVETIEAGIVAGQLTVEGDVEEAVTRLLATIDGMAVHTLLGLYEMSPERMESLALDAVASQFGVERALLDAPPSEMNAG